jgi:hypothetical protein
MARRNYLVEGLSGAGKSSVYEELIRRGYKAVSTDRAWKNPVDSTWYEHKALGELERSEPEVLFVCGSGRNRDRFLPYFTEIFNLRIDDDTMRRRLEDRTNNDYGKQPEELELMLRLNRSDEKPAGAIDVDATQPLEHVVDEVLRLAECEPVASTSVPWSGTAQSVVIPESALPSWDGRDVIARVDYVWSGRVLQTLLSYLEALGIDLTEAVLTSDHRVRYEARLDPSTFDGAELRVYYDELNATAAHGVEYAMLDGIAFLRDTLARLEPATVAVLVIS